MLRIAARSTRMFVKHHDYMGPTMIRPAAWFVSLAIGFLSTSVVAEERLRVRDLGIVVGTFEPGPLNAITDVAGVQVGHATVVRGDTVRTGVTVIFPHTGDLFASRVPAAAAVGNGFGKFVGITN